MSDKSGHPIGKREPPPLDFDYDAEADVMTIEGIHYAGDLFRGFGRAMPLETPFKVVERPGDGVLVLVQMEPGDPDWRAGMTDPDAGTTIDHPQLGKARMATEEQRALIADFVSATPLSVFLELQRTLNLRGMLLLMKPLEDIIAPPSGRPAPGTH